MQKTEYCANHTHPGNFVMLRCPNVLMQELIRWRSQRCWLQNLTRVRETILYGEGRRNRCLPLATESRKCWSVGRPTTTQYRVSKLVPSLFAWVALVFGPVTLMIPFPARVLILPTTAAVSSVPIPIAITIAATFSRSYRLTIATGDAS